jgi:hypothetical protein
MISTMRGLSSLALLAAGACGPMYQAPAPPAPTPEPVFAASDPMQPVGVPVTAVAAGAAVSPNVTATGTLTATEGHGPTLGEQTAAESAGGGGHGSIADRFLAAHAAARAKHCAAALTWSDTLAAYAQRWADHLKSNGCTFGHSNGQYGENLGAGTQGTLDPEATVRMWYDEGQHYDFRRGGFSMTTGHFTQLVWRATQHLGCGHAVCNGLDIWVCEYDPAGNVEGEYAANVLPTSCKR